MALTKQQVATAASTLYLLVLVVIAAYSTHRIQALSLPIPTVLGGLTVILPILSGLAISSVSTLLHPPPVLPQTISHKPTPHRGVLYTTLAALLVYETVLTTLAGTYLAPAGSLGCGLDERWQALFSAKDAGAVRRVQDAFDCCGLHSARDRAWPFPGGGADASACVVRYRRDAGCFGEWRREEQTLAGLLVLVGCLSFAWKAAVLASLQPTPGWVSRLFRSGRGSRLGLEYPGEPYRDDPVAEIEDEEETQLGGAIEGLVREREGTERGFESRVQPSRIMSSEL